MKWEVGLQGPRKMNDEWSFTAEYILAVAARLTTAGLYMWEGG